MPKNQILLIAPTTSAIFFMNYKELSLAPFLNFAVSGQTKIQELHNITR
jgi:hypothetical protein